MPPCVHCGARVEPWRAWPVPFWRHGFLPPPETSERVRADLGALALVGQVILNHVEHDALVGFNPEYGLGKFDGTNLFAGHIKYCYLRHLYSSFPYALTLSRMTT